MPRRRPPIPFPLPEIDFAAVYDLLSRPKTIDELIELLGMGPEVIDAAIRDGRLATRELGGHTVIFNEDVKRFLAGYEEPGESAPPPAAA
jgi:hypothetical protein